jgi:hypothetical protein
MRAKRPPAQAGCAIISDVDTSEIQAAFNDVFDQAMVFHGFADYMRDYEVFIYATANPRTGIRPEHLRYRFKHCVRATVTTALSPEVWKRSLDERLVDYEHGHDLDGYVWGVKWQALYPGMKLVLDSADARRWSDELTGHVPGWQPSEPVARSCGHVAPLPLSPGTSARARRRCPRPGELTSLTMWRSPRSGQTRATGLPGRSRRSGGVT